MSSFSFLWFELQIGRRYIGILSIIYNQDRDANVALEMSFFLKHSLQFYLPIHPPRYNIHFFKKRIFTFLHNK